MTTRTGIALACSLLSGLFTFSGSVSALEAPRAIVLIADKLAVEDLVEFRSATASLHESAGVGAVGLMNVRTAGGADSANGYLSISAGRRAVATSWSPHAFAPSEIYQGRPAHEVYESLTGLKAEGEALHLGIGQLMAAHAPGKTPPGTLGQAFADAGLKTALIGTGDTPGERTRLGALIAMNQSGRVDVARLGREVLVDDLAWPTGIRTNYEELLTALERALHRAHLVVVDLADLARLEHIAPYLDPQRANDVRREALERISTFTQSVVRRAPQFPGESVAVYLLSPSPPKHFGRLGILATPVFRWHDSPPGLLTSATTRRTGIVTNADFVAALLTDMQIGVPAGVTGRAWRVEPHPDPLNTLIDQYESIRAVHLQRLPVIQPYFFLVLACMATGVALVFAVNYGYLNWSTRRNTLWGALLVALAAFPVTLLLLGSLAPESLGLTLQRLIAILAAITVAFMLIGRHHTWGAIGGVAIATSLLLIVDVVLGAPLQQRSLLGYDPIAGSRYYGVGNEYMGVLIGSTLIGLALLLDGRGRNKGATEDRRTKRTLFMWPSFVMAALALLFLHPRMGINVGGAITAGSGAVVTHFFLRDRRITLRQGVLWSLAIAALLVGVGIIDYLILQRDASHLGRVVGLVADSGSDPLWDLFARKVEVNAKLIRLTIWSRVAILSLSLLGVVYLWPNWLADRLGRAHPWLMRMTRVALVTALIALVFNDSGIVAAAMLLLWPALVTLSLAVEMAVQNRRERNILKGNAT